MAKKISKAEFRAEKEAHQKSKFGEVMHPFESFVFEKGLVLELLSQPGTDYLRVYYGSNREQPTVILSAAAGNSYFDVSTYYVEWPTGLNANGEPVSKAQ